VQSWEPYRCCTIYGVNVYSFEMVILSVGDSKSFFTSFANSFVNAWVLNFVCFVFLWAAVFGHIMWVAERNHNSLQFPPNYLSGIDDAMWWVVVTFTTVGYGDKIPVTPLGRVFAVVWMVLGLALSSILIGRMSATFDAETASVPFNSAEELAGKKVCSYASSLGRWYLPESVSYLPVIGENIDECGLMLERGEVDAVVMEKQIMAYWMKSNVWARQAPVLVGDAIATVPMGLIFSQNSSVVEAVNERMIRMFESDVHRNIKDRWLKLPHRNEPNDEIQWPIVGTAIGCALLYGCYQLLPRRWRMTAEVKAVTYAAAAARKASDSACACSVAVESSITAAQRAMQQMTPDI